MELMVGKILGQMAVGLLILALYAGLGIAALVSSRCWGCSIRCSSSTCCSSS